MHGKRVAVDDIQKYLSLEAKKVGIQNVIDAVDAIDSERVRIHPDRRTIGVDIEYSSRIRAAILKDLQERLNNVTKEMEALCES